MKHFDFRDRLACAEVHRLRRELVRPCDQLDLVDKKPLDLRGNVQMLIKLLFRHAAAKFCGTGQIQHDGSSRTTKKQISSKSSSPDT